MNHVSTLDRERLDAVALYLLNRMDLDTRRALMVEYPTAYVHLYPTAQHAVIEALRTALNGESK